MNAHFGLCEGSLVGGRSSRGCECGRNTALGQFGIKGCEEELWIKEEMSVCQGGGTAQNRKGVFVARSWGKRVSGRRMWKTNSIGADRKQIWVERVGESFTQVTRCL